MVQESPIPPQGLHFLYQRNGAIWLARQYDLDTQQFRTCLDQDTHVPSINNATRRARAEAADPNGSLRTPAIYIQGRRVAATAEAIIQAVRSAAQ